MRLAILASGRGSNFQAIVEAIQNNELPVTDVLLVTNNPKAGAIEKAKALSVPYKIVASKPFRREGKLDRLQFEESLCDTLTKFNPALICLAGYMLILGDTFLSRFEKNTINIHPSLLPKYKGLHPIRRAIENNESEIGCTVHYVSQEVDGGEIILQKKLSLSCDDTEQSATSKLLPLEHEAYVAALKKIL